jgi:2-dehydropantoate 2-reductase
VIGPVDVVFNCLKARRAWQSAEAMAPLVDAVDRGGRQWRAIGPDRAIGCSVYPAAEIAGPAENAAA